MTIKEEKKVMKAGPSWFIHLPESRKLEDEEMVKTSKRICMRKLPAVLDVVENEEDKDEMRIKIEKIFRKGWGV